MAKSILVVDDLNSAAEFLRLLLVQNGYRVTTASNGVEALLALEKDSYDLVISDLDRPEMDGFELLQRVGQRWADLPVITVTALSDVSKVVEAVRLGAIDYLLKPAVPEAVLGTVRKALMARPRAEAPRSIPELVGRSRAIVEVRHLVTLATRSNVPVLITGETGCGKELVARAIHRYSPLAERPFVPHNCAVMPKELFESQFFGHRRGSFTGADRDHDGLLTQADRGVLFLDEVQALLHEHQAKLLRVLDDGEVRPVGGSKSRQVTVRFLAATNRDPQEMIAGGELREDLYYRLRGVEIPLPPLRDRREDIPLLAVHFLGDAKTSFSPEAIEALEGARWPGNVRQLRHVVHSSAAAAGESEIGVHHLSLDDDSRTPAADGDASDALRGTLRDVERRAIVQALEDSAWNRSKAARILDIDRSTLRRKMKEYEIDDGE
jgi:two-component system response regulator PilR (NtrC family)